MRRALGKGLSQLIAEQYDGTPSEAPIDSIQPNARQPRLHFNDDSLEELASSIREFGILQPLTVRPASEGRYELIAGERRLRAAKLAGLKTVPIIVRAATNEASLQLALIENIQREDINPMECARAYRMLIDEFSLTQDQIAEKVGKSRPAVANAMRLLRLPKRIQEGLTSGTISEGHARALLAYDNEVHQLAIYDQILEKGLTVRDVERGSKPKGSASAKASKTESTRSTDPNWQSLEEALSLYFATPVRLNKADIGGKISIDFYSDDDLERILGVLGITL